MPRTAKAAAPPASISEDMLKVGLVPIASLAPYARNARIHPEEQIEGLVRSIMEFGFTNPVIADAAGIVAGHGRVEAARRLYATANPIKLPNGREIPIGTVPVIDCTGWSAEQRRAYVLADNALPLSATWDTEMLAAELNELEAAGFDVSLIGFSEEDLLGLRSEPGDGDGTPMDPEEARQTLAERFGIPPFSVFNAREGWWQDRKRAWMALGIKSEVGRGEHTAPGGAPAPLDRAKNGEANAVPGRAAKARKANAEPGGSKMPAADYSKNKARGNGRGKAIA